MYGIEPWRRRCFFDVDVYEDYKTEYTDPAWYKESFRKFRVLGEELQYAASIIVPNELLQTEE